MSEGGKRMRRIGSWFGGRAEAPPPAPAPAAEAPAWLRHAAWNTKVMGSAIARQFYAAGLAGAKVAPQPHPRLARLTGRLARQADMESAWAHHWCGRLGMVPLYHRKVWEECFVAQALWEAGMLAPRRKALGFAVGRELLPALLAGAGAEVLATDLDMEDDRARVWNKTGQHASAADALFHPHLVPRADFDARVRLRAVDMNHIPGELRGGGFDCLWSVCSLEHLGSLQAGMDFVVAAMDCLRPGGIAVHTTEFNVEPEGPTIESGATVLYQRRHLDSLGDRLAAAGHMMAPVDYAPGDGVLDRFIDLPPYMDAQGGHPVPDAPHLRLSFGEHVVTSVGFIVKAGGAAGG